MADVSRRSEFWGSQLKTLAKGERGQALALALIIIVVVSLITVPVVVLVGTSLISNRSAQFEAYTVAGAQAGVEAVAADLVRGADALAGSYSPPAVTVNDHTPAVTIANPITLALPTPVPVIQYFDPGLRSPDLKTVNPQEGYLLVMHNVITGTLQVNWAYSPGAVTRVGLWDIDLSTAGHTPGVVTSFPTNVQPILDTGRTSGQATYNRSDEIPVNMGTYSVVFYNANPQNILTSAAFTPGIGPSSSTWIRANAYKDYLVTSRAGNSEIVAYLRQTPGITQPPMGSWSPTNVSWITNTVTVESWQGP